MKSPMAFALIFTLFSAPLAAVAADGSPEEPGAPASGCPEYLNHSFKKLHSSDRVNICDLYTGGPMVIINTASHCGFTPQFKDLENLNQKYQDKGLTVIGFASDDFNQAAKDEAEAATICYKNFGVTFTMLAPTSVKGKNANAVFQHLNEEAGEPGWNFNKFLITNQGTTIKKFGSRTRPMNSRLEDTLKKSL
mgnify:CR=1 FL=1|jgi:Glutathione peroxidase